MIYLVFHTIRKIFQIIDEQSFFLNFHPCSSAQAAIKSDSGMKAVCLAAAGLRNKKSGGIICLQVKNDVLFINTEGGGDEIIYENFFQLGIWKNSSGSSVLIR